MLKIIRKSAELNYSELMNVYFEDNLKNGREKYPNDSVDSQLRKAETDLFEYLHSVFFRQCNSIYAVWEEKGRYQSALRLEPYCDGYLLCALETAPCARRKGYASLLVNASRQYLSQFGNGIIYTHVSKSNIPSIKTHMKCGFRIIKDYAVYLDGSVLHNSYTFAYEYKKSEI